MYSNIANRITFKHSQTILHIHTYNVIFPMCSEYILYIILWYHTWYYPVIHSNMYWNIHIGLEYNTILYIMYWNIIPYCILSCDTFQYVLEYITGYIHTYWNVSQDISLYSNTYSNVVKPDCMMFQHIMRSPVMYSNICSGMLWCISQYIWFTILEYMILRCNIYWNGVFPVYWKKHHSRCSNIS